MAKKKGRCKNCVHWEKGRCYPHKEDWGLCHNDEIHKELSISSSRIGTFENFGCVHQEPRIFVKM